MGNLAKIQAALIKDIYEGTQESLPYIAEGHHDRLSVYHNNTYLGLTDLLKNFFSVTHMLIGNNCFKACAKNYIRAHPMHGGDRNEYGAGFAASLKKEIVLSKLPYVPEIAELEWAFFTSSNAETSTTPLTMAALQNQLAITPDPSLALNAHVQLLTHQHNTLEIWQAHQNKPENIQVELKTATHNILIWRDLLGDVYMQTITPTAYQFLQACEQGTSLSQCLTQAISDHDQLTVLQENFVNFINLGLFKGK